MLPKRVVGLSATRSVAKARQRKIFASSMTVQHARSTLPTSRNFQNAALTLDVTLAPDLTMKKIKAFYGLIADHRSPTGFKRFEVTGVRMARSGRYGREAYEMVCSDNVTRCQVIIDNPANRKRLAEMRRYDLEANKLSEKESAVRRKLQNVSAYEINTSISRYGPHH
jgi:hypothetical protein